jgi:hypothetical protein
MAVGRKYAYAGNCVNTASTTLPVGNVLSATTIRPAIIDITLGSDGTPADNAVKYAFQRETTAGTWAGAGGAAITGQALDPADPAALSSGNQGVCSAGPTLTASAFVWQWAHNMRASVRWVAAPGEELQMPATANNGLALVPLVVGGSAFNCVFCFIVQE